MDVASAEATQQQPVVPTMLSRLGTKRQLFGPSGARPSVAPHFPSPTSHLQPLVGGRVTISNYGCSSGGGDTIGTSCGGAPFYPANTAPSTFCRRQSFAAFAAFRKINRIDWRIIETKLKSLIEAFGREVTYVKGSSMTPSEATTTISRESFEIRLSELRSTIELEGGLFKRDHLGFLVILYLGALLYMISIMSFTYFMCTGMLFF
ncbi:hypothetical protein Salat_1525100 [Sesamum alatum]|uniref:Uncharacterized protein n=1 Tax=Sesamum alatum TaxID=300844 RepID=A0AAE2CME8_9LAMI|nr:hypothetical protein Salat_1525100 [Sesamum alatum]